MKVLIVDDDDDVRKVFKMSFSNPNRDLFLASNGTEAIEIIDRTPDLDWVITDYNMPGCDGLEVVKHIKKHFPWIKVAVMSGEMSITREKMFLDAGANAVIQKPAFAEIEKLLSS